MRTLAPLLAVLILTAADPAVAAAQEVGDALALTGCLAQDDDDDGEVEYLLQNVSPAQSAATEIELIAAEDVSLAAHVGHTVEISGVVVADDEVDEDDEDEVEEEDDEENELHIRVTGMRHIAASCGGAR